ncbi:hypothetical protein BOTBODRAFT_35736 [Botryobasidium botryosum FD-172 SS1]|uniref:Uncharacterized protein n=1 Tax=Botryobasidium botryosum (strain FD-172 SS1) TaxID=930990 RepID=A0A067MGG3_BOTB1|nr:hypothetical protein BOTBODRAFT_35736 [Botryobasidium botryosum FD-172 SS1]
MKTCRRIPASEDAKRQGLAGVTVNSQRPQYPLPSNPRVSSSRSTVVRMITAFLLKVGSSTQMLAPNCSTAPPLDARATLPSSIPPPSHTNV